MKLGVKARLARGEVVFGGWVQTGSAAAAGILANTSGFCWMGIDCEHSDIGLRQMSELIASLRVSPLVRVRENDTLAIRHALDNGAEGVIIPLINTADDARRAVDAAKYPPLGKRGYGFCRANQWGKDFDRYSRESNEDTLLLAMIESRSGVEQVDQILAVEGIDGVFIGPYDLSGSYGIPGETDHPLVLEAMDRVLDACKRSGKHAGLHIVSPTAEAIAQRVAAGYTFLALGADIIFLNQCCQRMGEMIQQINR